MAIGDQRPAGADFRFRSGRLCLDFTATMGGRHLDPIERLLTPADLRRWFGLAIPRQPASRPTDRDLGAARSVREAVYRLVHPSTRDRPLATDIAVLNRWAGRAGFAPRLGPDARSLVLRVDRGCEAALATVATDAIDLLCGPLLGRVRECTRPSCSLLFLDLSRVGGRRWCDMTSCGNLAKAERFRARARAGQVTPARRRRAGPAP